MLTTLKLALAAAIAATGGYALQNVESPSKAQTEKPVWTLASSEVPVQTDVMSRRVSVSIDGTVADVAKWLTGQGVSFVISDPNLAERKVMVNLVDQPLKNAVDAIGEALGGQWLKKGDVYVFQTSDPLRGTEGKYLKWDPKAFAAPKIDMKDFQGGHLFVMPKTDAKDFKFEFEMPKIDLKELEKLDGKAFVMPKIDWKELKSSDGRKMTDAERKEVEAAMKQAQEEMRKAMEEVKKAGKMRLFSEGELKELKGLKEMKIEGLSKAQRLEMEKALKDARVNMDKAREEMKKSGEMRLFSEKQLKELKELKGSKFVFEGGQIGQLLKSLTPAQKSIHKSKGYLTPNDLTPEQRRMLPNMDGDWNISFVVDGQKLSLRNK